MTDQSGVMAEAPLRIAYADPPYPGQSAKHYADHADYDGEVSHFELAERLTNYDGWILHTSSVALLHVMEALASTDEYPLDPTTHNGGGTYRVMAWVKPFAAFKANVSVAYSWEPVLVKAARKPIVNGHGISRDYIAEPITLRRGLAGAKPEAVCRWCFHVVGAQPGDELHDLFPGTGAVTRAWEAWRAQGVFA